MSGTFPESPESAPLNRRPASVTTPAEAPALRRTLSLSLLTFYGLGTIIGAGIYVLIGKIAGVAGLYTPVAFLIAAAAAFLTAFTYAELSARFPKSAGEALYVARGFDKRQLSIAVGLMVVASGLISAATIANGFVGYLNVFADVPRPVAIAALVVALGALAVWGIAESVMVATASTIIEVAGLLVIIVVCGDSLAELPHRAPALVPPAQAETWHAILLGAFLAFYAFIGFEDMVNVAEEARNPVRDMPRAILIATAVATGLYILLALIAVLAIAPAELAASDAPLALLYERATGKPAVFISLIGVFAVVNGALIQIIMAARVLYGMSREGWIPAPFGVVHRRTRTPLLATGVVAGTVLVLALALPLIELARATSFVILLVFVLVNLALLRLKLRGVAPPAGAWRCPAWVPAAGAAVSLGLLAAQAAAFVST